MFECVVNCKVLVVRIVRCLNVLGAAKFCCENRLGVRKN